MWNYNNRNELTGTVRYNGSGADNPGDGNADANLDRDYDYDPIGNRRSSKIGLAASVYYCANTLNQYTTTDDAAACPAPSPTETFQHDLDGNLTQSLSTGTIAPGSGRQQTYKWDAENRLSKIEVLGTPQAGDKTIAFKYDYLGRRVQAEVSTFGGSSWTVSETRRYLWYNWLMLIETEGAASTPAIRRKFTWGLDLAGLSGQVNSMESAGGIGGLLGVLDTLGTTSTSDDYKYTYFHDGNGNVTQLVDRTQTTLASALRANYEYDAYGNTTFEGGSYAATNRWRFSTKVFDAETELGYWGYRYYLPRVGRWGIRDPIGENGGLALYVALHNAASVFVDVLGAQSCRPENVVPAIDYLFTGRGTTFPARDFDWFYGHCVVGNGAAVTLTGIEACQVMLSAQNAKSIIAGITTRAETNSHVGLKCGEVAYYRESFGRTLGRADGYLWDLIINHFTFSGTANCTTTRLCCCGSSGTSYADTLITTCKWDISGYDFYDFGGFLGPFNYTGTRYVITWKWAPTTTRITSTCLRAPVRFSIDDICGSVAAPLPGD